MEGFNDFLNMLVLIVLSISTLIQVLDMCGLLPEKLKRRLKLNHAQETIDVLKELGVDIDRYRRANTVVGIPRDYSKDNIEENIRNDLETLKIDKMVSVGKVRQTELNYYIDLIGHTCDPNTAVAYARTLSSYWADAIEDNSYVKSPVFDFVVTPKDGSPILGYEFAKLLNKPFLLHEASDRFISESDDMRKRFNCAEIPAKGSTALIVDDSTTGGRMVISAIEDLKKYGYNVTECLVVFEPQQKDARRKLNDKGVNLISIVKTHT